MMNNLSKDKNLNELSKQIKDWAKELGFSSIGITDVDLSEDQRYLDKWLKKGYQGEMNYLNRNNSKREFPEKLVQGTKRIISVTMNYLPEGYNGKDLLASDKKAFISGYARGRDYHKLMRSRLRQLANRIKNHSAHSNRVFVDSAPVLEKAIAQKAGLGWIGKNTLLLNKNSGSYFFLGEIYTDLELQIDQPNRQNHCGSCTSFPNMLPIGTAFGIWAVVDGNVGFMVAVGMGSTLGIIVDFTVHLLSKYDLARRELGKTPEESVIYSFEAVGFPLIIMTIVLSIGFLTLTMGSFIPLGDFAKFSSIAFITALFIDFYLFPNLLVRFDKRNFN